MKICKINNTLLSGPEKILIDWICSHIPAYIRPDHLTALGVAGGVLVFTGFLFSNWDAAFLWLTSVGLVLNWAGDSVDGSLARYRRSERPRYGYFVDHMTDSFVMTLVGIGAGLSPFLSIESCLLVLVSYLLLTIFSVLEAKVSDVLRISFGRIGPTEFRIFLLVLVAFLYWYPRASVEVLGHDLNAYDAVLYATSAVLGLVCLFSAFSIGRELAKADPGKE